MILAAAAISATKCTCNKCTITYIDGVGVEPWCGINTYVKALALYRLQIRKRKKGKKRKTEGPPNCTNKGGHVRIKYYEYNFIRNNSMCMKNCRTRLSHISQYLIRKISHSMVLFCKRHLFKILGDAIPEEDFIDWIQDLSYLIDRRLSVLEYLMRLHLLGRN